MFRIAASLLWQPATGFVGTQFRLAHREPRARQALVTNHRMCQHNKPRACMHIIASLKGFRLQTHADEGMPVASRAVQVRIYRCTHDHDSQLAHALAPAVKVCRRSDMMQINASCQSCAKRPSARCPVAGSPSQVCPNRSICDRTGSVAALPASVRASYFACLMSVRFCVHSTGRTPRAGHSGSPQRPSDLDRETVRQWVLWPRPWESIWCSRGSRLVCCGADARVVPTHQRTPSWTKSSGAVSRLQLCSMAHFARRTTHGGWHFARQFGQNCTKIVRAWSAARSAAMLGGLAAA